jgi:hypothetical protein
MKKCPPGVICVENITLFILFSIILIIVYLLHIRYYDNNNHNHKHKHNHSPERHHHHIEPSIFVNDMIPRPDVLLNPYTPPLRDDRYGRQRGLVPINVSTNIGAVDTTYRQVGILTPVKITNDDTSTNKILALIGRPLFTNRDKWQFYTMTKNNIKLPIFKNGKSGTSEYGCDNIYTGDRIHVEGYNDAFKATIYDNNTIQYIPSI